MISNIKNLKVKILPLFMVLSSCMLEPPLSAQSAAVLEKTSEDFEMVAQKAIPAVVSIQVKSAPKVKSFYFNGKESNENDFFDFFGGDDLFGRFFGIPKREGSVSAPEVALASGFIISKDGYILTNDHVVSSGGTITVTLDDGREFPAKIIGQDDATDLALIKIDAGSLPYLNMGDSDKLKIGQWVVAIGNPFGLQASLTVGVVSAKGRSNLDIARVEDFIQTDAAINRGNSGGPLLNLNGDVIGINTAIATNMASGYMGVGFAIPSTIAKHVIDQLMDTGHVTRGFLGVSLQRVDSSLAQAFGLKKAEGALVADVTRDSPAAKAGIRQGDIILKYNDHVVDSIGALRNAVALGKPGESAHLTVLREGKTIQVAATVGLFPEEKQAPAAQEEPHDTYGLDVKTLTPEIAKSLNVPSDENGVVVVRVNPNSPAGIVGIKKGALILSVNQQKVHSAEEYQKELKATPAGKPVLLLIKQGGAMRFISLRVE